MRALQIFDVVNILSLQKLGARPVQTLLTYIGEVCRLQFPSEAAIGQLLVSMCSRLRPFE